MESVSNDIQPIVKCSAGIRKRGKERDEAMRLFGLFPPKERRRKPE